MQPGECQLHLRLHARRPRHTAPARRLPGQVVQQHGLAHARITPHYQGPALPGPDRLTSRPSTSHSARRSISPVARPCRLAFAVIGPPLRRVPAAPLGVSAHMASRLLQITGPMRPRPAAASTSGATRSGRRSRPHQARFGVMATTPARPGLRHCVDRSVTRQEKTGNPCHAPADAPLSAAAGRQLRRSPWRTWHVQVARRVSTR